MTAIPAAVQTEINNCALKVTQLHPTSNATQNNIIFTNMFTAYPNVPGALWGQFPWGATKAAAFCTEMEHLGVSVTNLRAFCGV